MKKLKIFSIATALICLFGASVVFAANGNDTAANSEQGAQASASSDAQAQQMLKQIKALQAKQEQEYPSNAAPQEATSTVNRAPVVNASAESAYKSSFEFPFEQAQVRHSRVYKCRLPCISLRGCGA